MQVYNNWGKGLCIVCRFSRWLAAIASGLSLEQVFETDLSWSFSQKMINKFFFLRIKIAWKTPQKDLSISSYQATVRQPTSDCRHFNVRGQLNMSELVCSFTVALAQSESTSVAAAENSVLVGSQKSVDGATSYLYDLFILFEEVNLIWIMSPVWSLDISWRMAEDLFARPIAWIPLSAQCLTQLLAD